MISDPKKLIAASIIAVGGAFGIAVLADKALSGRVDSEIKPASAGIQYEPAFK